MTRKKLEKLMRAISGGITHLMACERGDIHRPFKSGSLPLLKEALNLVIEEHKKGGRHV